MEIDSDLRIGFYGERNVEKKGFFVGQTPPEFWDSLQLSLVHFDKLDSLYEDLADDLYFETTVHFGKNDKTVSGTFASLPGSVQKTLQWAADSYKRINLEPSPDTGYLYARLRYPDLRPPRFDVKRSLK